MNPYQQYMEKVALNALTKRIDWSKQHLRFSPSPNVTSEVQHGMWLNGADIGHIQIDRRKAHSLLTPSTWDLPKSGPASEATSVAWSEVGDAYQGMGLAKKLYGRAMRHEYEQGRNLFRGDHMGTISDDAHRVWGSFERRGKPVQRIVAPGNPGKTSYQMDLEKLYEGPRPRPTPQPKDVLSQPRQTRQVEDGKTLPTDRSRFKLNAFL